MSALLELARVSARYDTSQVLFDVDLQVHNGEVVTLIGRNGVGKSTTVKTVMGLLPGRSGSVRFAGEEIGAWPPYCIARAGIGLVPEGRQVFPTLSVEENLVATALQRDGVKPQWNLPAVYRMFPRLMERRRHLGAALSGGEQQMLAIGRALMTNPSLLILDEATEGLAPIVRSQIWACLAQLKAAGLSIIVIDKHVGPLLRLGDRHYILEKGRVVWVGASDELRQRKELLHAYVGV